MYPLGSIIIHAIAVGIRHQQNKKQDMWSTEYQSSRSKKEPSCLVLAMEGQGCGLMMKVVAMPPPPGHPLGDQPQRDAYEPALPTRGRDFASI
jgi:hypothetical protein